LKRHAAHSRSLMRIGVLVDGRGCGNGEECPRSACLHTFDPWGRP
jgi:hypothetical protein